MEKEKVKISWRQAQTFVLNAPRILVQEEHFTKFKFALEKQFKKIKAKVDSLLTEKMKEVEMEYALTEKIDKKDVYVFDENGKFKFAKENELKVMVARRNFYEDAERGIEITPHYLELSHVPEYFSLEMLEMCYDILFRQFESEDAMEEWYLSRGKDPKGVKKTEMKVEEPQLD